MKIKEFNTGPAVFLIAYQLILLLTLPFYFYFHSVSIGMILTSIALLFITGISITGGYHRYFSHRCFKTNPVIESILLFFSSMAGQGSALRWAFDHRLHHAHVDTDEDPYSIKRGFWYAHFLWILEKPKEIDPKIVPDLIKNPRVMFQHRFAGTLMLVTNAIVFFFVGWLFNDFWGAFFLATWLRLFTLHHFTWFINSLAHTWGDKPFCQEQSAVNNYILSFLTFGEGYHNYHHTFANDYRNGVRWYHFDPTKWMIWGLYKLGLAHSLKKVDASVIRKRMITERKRLLLDRLCDLWYVKKEELEKKIEELSDQLITKNLQIQELKKRYYQFKSQIPHSDMLKELQNEIILLKKSIKEDWLVWKALSRQIMQLEPI